MPTWTSPAPYGRVYSYIEITPDGEGYMGQFTTGGSSVQRVFQSDWQKHAGDIQSLIGFQSVKTAVNGAGRTRYYISRSIPMPDPEYPNLFCGQIPRSQGVQLRGTQVVQPNESVAKYTQAKLTLAFKSYLFRILPDAAVSKAGGILGSFGAGGTGGVPTEADGLLTVGQNNAVPTRYVTKMQRPSSRVITLRRGVMRIVQPITGAPGAQIPEGLPLSEGRTTLTYTWHNVPEAGVPINAIGACLGTINSVPIAGYPAQTLLFDSVDIRPDLDIVGDLMYQVQYQFVYAPNCDRLDPARTPLGWNYVLYYNPALPFSVTSILPPPLNVLFAKPFLNYLLVTSDGTVLGQKSYALTNFGALFVPDQNPVVW